MADITRFPMVRHLRGTPTLHVRHLRRGRLVHDGTGLSFFFRPLTAVLSEIPVDDRELPMLFHARTADFQDLTVQASVTFRVIDPVTASDRIDFSVSLSVASDQLVLFGDFIEADAVPLAWGQTVSLRLAQRTLNRLR